MEVITANLYFTLNNVLLSQKKLLDFCYYNITNHYQTSNIMETTTTTTRTIAGLTFSNEGIVITRPYNDNPEVLFNKRPKEDVYTGKWLDLAKRLAKYRMASCYKKLHANLATATHVTPDMIAWKDGRFTVSVWDALMDILSLNDVRNLTKLQAQQLIRARLFDKSSNWLYDHDENWNETREGDIYMDEDFIMFLTEHVVIKESNI